MCTTVFAVVVLYIVVSFCFLGYVISIDRSFTKKESEKFLQYNGIDIVKIEDDFKLKNQKVCIESRHGHEIPVEYVLANGSYDNESVILVHGYEMDLSSVYPIANLFL